MAKKDQTNTWLLVAAAAAAIYFLFFRSSSTSPAATSPAAPGFTPLQPVSQIPAGNISPAAAVGPTLTAMPSQSILPPDTSGMTPAQIAFLQSNQGLT